MLACNFCGNVTKVWEWLAYCSSKTVGNKWLYILFIKSFFRQWWDNRNVFEAKAIEIWFFTEKIDLDCNIQKLRVDIMIGGSVGKIENWHYNLCSNAGE